MNISVIIPVKNDEKNIREAVKSILNQKIDKKFEVIVVDNNSTDNTIEKIKDLPIKILKEKRPSASSARNKGIKNSKGKILVFTDADCVANKKWLNNHINFHKKGDVVMGRNFLHPKYKNSLVAKTQEYGLLPYFDFNFLEKDLQNLDFWNLYTSNLSVKRKVFEKVGLFNEQFKFAGSEDTEFGYRLILNNFKILYNPKAIIFHKHKNKLSSAFRRAVISGRQAIFLTKKIGKLPRKRILLKRIKKLTEFSNINFLEKIFIFFLSLFLLIGFTYGAITFRKLYS